MKTLLDPELCWRVLLTLGHFLWQGAAIALIAAAAAWLLRRASARARYGVWTVAMSLMTLCPVGTFVYLSAAAERPALRTDVPQEAPAPPVQVAKLPPVLPAAEAPAPAPLPVVTPPHVAAAPVAREGADWKRFAPHLMTVYLLGVALMFGRLCFALHGAVRLRRAAVPVTDPDMLDMIARRSRALRLRCAPAVAFCKEVVVPTVVGLLRPTILLPFTFATGLSPGQVEAILIHELEHIRRHDFLVNIFQRVVEAALFFHPAVWWVSRRIRIEREHCCDDAVVAAGCEPMTYAESLVTQAERALAARAGRCAAAALYADGGSGDLRGRVARILRIPPNGEVRLRVWPLAVVVVVALSAAGIWAVERPGRESAGPTTSVSDTDPAKQIWGTAVDGLQAQLSADKTDFQLGEEVAVTFTIRNVSSAPVTLRESRDKVYGYAFFTHFHVTCPDGTAVVLGDPPGDSKNFIMREVSFPEQRLLQSQESFTTTEHLNRWRATPAQGGFGFAPGTYQIKAEYRYPPHDGLNEGNWTGTLLSNALEIRVGKQPVPPAPADVAWGEPSHGLRVGLATDKVVYADSESISGRMLVENVSDAPIEIGSLMTLWWQGAYQHAELPGGPATNPGHKLWVVWLAPGQRLETPFDLRKFLDSQRVSSPVTIELKASAATNRNPKEPGAWRDTVYSPAVRILKSDQIPAIRTTSESDGDQPGNGHAGSPPSSEADHASVAQPSVIEAYRKRIHSILPAGWSLQVNRDVLKVARDAPVDWLNTISLPAHRDRAELKTMGFVQQGRYEITLRFEAPYGPGKLAELTAKNQRTSAALAELAGRMTPFLDSKRKPSDETGQYFPKTAEDRALLQQYLTLRRSLLRLPEVNHPDASISIDLPFRAPQELFDPEVAAECSRVADSVMKEIRADKGAGDAGGATNDNNTIHSVPAVLDSLKQDLLRLGGQFPELAGVKDIKLRDGGLKLDYQHQCRYLGKRGYEDAGDHAFAIGIEVMPNDTFADNVQTKEMPFPSHQWKHLKCVGWSSLHFGKSPSAGLSVQAEALLKRHLAMLDALDQAAAREDSATAPSASHDGAQLRLRAERAEWRADEIPCLWWNLRNSQGSKWLHVFDSQRAAQLEVDGVWYVWPVTFQGGAVRELPAGGVLDDRLLTLSPIWTQARPDDLEDHPSGRVVPAETPPSLHLTPGKHKIRLAMGFKGGAVSEPVELTILALPNGQAVPWQHSPELATAIKETLSQTQFVLQESLRPGEPAMREMIAKAVAKAGRAASIAAKTPLEASAQWLFDSLKELGATVEQDPTKAQTKFAEASAAYRHLVGYFSGELPLLDAADRGGLWNTQLPVPTVGAAFGPVIERVVGDPRGSDTECFLDLDTGKLLDWPAAPEVRQQLKERGVEVILNSIRTLPETKGSDVTATVVIADGKVQQASLSGERLLVRDVPAEAWDQWTAAEVVQHARLHMSLWGFIPEIVELKAVLPLPKTWTFVTGEGGIGKGAAGILQITGANDNPRGLKLRYKLVGGTGGMPALPDADKPASEYHPGPAHEGDSATAEGTVDLGDNQPQRLTVETKPVGAGQAMLQARGLLWQRHKGKLTCQVDLSSTGQSPAPDWWLVRVMILLDDDRTYSTREIVVQGPAGYKTAVEGDVTRWAPELDFGTVELNRFRYRLKIAGMKLSGAYAGLSAPMEWSKSREIEFVGGGMHCKAIRFGKSEEPGKAVAVLTGEWSVYRDGPCLLKIGVDDARGNALASVTRIFGPQPGGPMRVSDVQGEQMYLLQTAGNFDHANSFSLMLAEVSLADPPLESIEGDLRDGAFVGRVDRDILVRRGEKIMFNLSLGTTGFEAEPKDQLRAKIRIQSYPVQTATYRARLELLDSNGKVLRTATAPFTVHDDPAFRPTGGSIPFPKDDALILDLGPRKDLERATRFRLSLLPAENGQLNQYNRKEQSHD